MLRRFANEKSPSTVGILSSARVFANAIFHSHVLLVFQQKVLDCIEEDTA
jgi:hypothetical protein